MFLKLLVSIFSIAILIKNLSYAKYEYSTNQNTFGAISIALLAFTATISLNIALYLIRF